jgi:acetyl esterase/lipase
MRKSLILLPFLLAATPALAQPAAKQEIAYGKAPLQKLDFYKSAKPGAPLVIFIHGGSWTAGDKGNATGAAKVSRYAAAGYAFASLNYRLVPGVKVADEAQDVADAVGYLIAHAKELGFDTRKVVLMGHSAGAHLAALIATDPHYLAKSHIGLDKLAGVVLLDGAGYDVTSRVAEGGPQVEGTFIKAFGNDPAEQRAVSPTLQAAAPNARDFLILHIDREGGARQSEALGRALTAAGSRVQVQGVEGKGLAGHMQINRRMGDPSFAPTALVDQWIAARFAR